MNLIDMPLFTVIVPVYNLRDYIEVSLGSVLGQSFRDFEVIAVDDGSTDGSAAILDALSVGDERLRVFHKENSGVSASRNFALDKARGEWIVFVDGDDALRSDALEILARTIATHPNADLIGYGFEKVPEISPATLAKGESEKQISVTERDCSERAHFSALNHYMVWTEAMRRDMIGALRFEPMKNGEDVLFCNAIGLKANCYVEVGASLYLYLQRRSSARSNEWSLLRQEDYSAMNEGILVNLTNCGKRVDEAWLKRWIGTLMQYAPGAWSLPSRLQSRYFSRHAALIRSTMRLPGIPTYLRLWLAAATAIKWNEYFKLTAMWPMKIYGK